MKLNQRVLSVGTGLVVSLATLLAGCGGGGGGTGGGGAAGTGGTGGGGTGTATEPTCEAYCTAVTKNCTGEVAVYASKDVCVAACKNMPVGKLADTSGNTLGCRTYHAGAAAGSMENAVMHCPHAGPGGAGYCGSNCEGYCNLAQGACDTYESTAACSTACAGFSDMEPFTAKAVTGNTLQCRLYHASVASADPTTHCPHIGVSPTPGTCTDPTP